ncbi:hypothetical protein C8N36_104190 [Pelagimonas varians]|uniref:Uncharacterized protein n=1 Tax=Pelagimonas varians TaxID=696760 RepID=A0A238K839_9RHOB|nr:hypothetical protein C8N36_104190 [Pelagimonas varians]SMX38614.1 hypothetical protein PEV8663_01454 [Pelagimonas varians]
MYNGLKLHLRSIFAFLARCATRKHKLLAL